MIGKKGDVNLSYITKAGDDVPSLNILFDNVKGNPFLICLPQDCQKVYLSWERHRLGHGHYKCLNTSEPALQTTRPQNFKTTCPKVSCFAEKIMEGFRLYSKTFVNPIK